MTGPLLIGTTLGLIIETELASGNSFGFYSVYTLEPVPRDEEK
jgi:hypothetical protein